MTPRQPRQCGRRALATVPTAATVAAVVMTSLVTIAPSQAAAQDEDPPIVVTGSVLDVEQGTPVPQARVELRRVLPDVPVEVAAAQPPNAQVLTDESGSFRTPPVPQGEYRLLVSALGYRDLSQTVDVEGASPMDLAIQLVPEAMELDAVVVRGVRSRWLDDVGFYQRRERGIGRTFTRQELERRATSRVSDVFRTLAGVRLVSAGAQRRPYITFRGNCLPDIVLDGVNLGYDLRLDELIGAGQIEGIEVYRGSQTPLEYSTNGCGAILVWSLDPSAQEGEPFTWQRLVAAAIFIGASVLITR